MKKFKLILNIKIVSCIIGLLISYLTTLFSNILPHLTFLEGVGVYCLWTPIHHAFLGDNN